MLGCGPPASPHQGRVSRARVIGSWDLPSDTVDCFTATVSQGNLVTALHNHAHTQPRRAHGRRHTRACPGRPIAALWSQTGRRGG